MTDWGKAYGGSSSSGTNWGSIYGGGSGGGGGVPVGKNTGGGGGILGDIGGVLGGAASFGENSLRGFYNIGHAVTRDIINHPASLAAPPGPWTPLIASGISALEGGGGGHLMHDVVNPIAHSYSAKYAPIFEHPLTGSSYRGVRKDPFGTAIDIASLISAVPTAGESAILRGTTLGERLGAIGEGSRLSRVADRIEAARAPLSRQVETAKGSGLTAPYKIDAARNPIGRVVQRNVTLPLRESKALAHVPGVGAAGMPLKNFREAQTLAQAPDQIRAATYERSLTQLNRAEHTAIHVAAEGDRSLPPSMWRQQRVDYYKHQLANTVEAGARKDIQRQLHILGDGNAKLAAKIDKALTSPRPAFLKAVENARGVSLRGSEAGGFQPETTAARALAPAKQMRDAIGSPSGAAPGEHPFGDNFVFAHRGPPVARSASIGIQRASMPMGQIRRSMAQHVWEGTRQATGRLFTSPSIPTHDLIANVRTEFAHSFQDWVGQHAAHIPAETGIPKGWVKFNPEGVTGNKALLERGLYDSTEAHAGALDSAVKGMFDPNGASPLMVPEKYAKAMTQEFARSSTAVRYLIDKPMQVWRAAVLKYRPAWLVNNIVGQHMLYFLHASPTSLLRYMQMLRVEKGEGYAQNALLQALRVPAIRLKYLHMIDETGAHGVRVASTQGILGSSDKYGVQRRGQQWKEANPVPHNIIMAIPRAVKAIGDGNARLNQLIADDIPRGSLFISQARRSAAVRRIQKVGNEMNDSVSVFRKIVGPSTEEILRGLTDSERIAMLHKVNTALGDFNSMSAFERGTLRRFMPFYAWFKAVAGISKDLVIHHPEKINLLRNLETAAQQNPDIIPQGALPSWLLGAVAVGPVQNGAQPMLSAVGLNPFQTPVQMGKAALEVGSRLGLPGANQGQRPSDALGLLGPAFQIYDLLGGVNPLTGAATKQSVPGGFIGSLPQIRLAQGLGAPIPGLGKFKPSKTYVPSNEDLIYQYLGIPRRHVILKNAANYAASGF